MKKLIGWVLSIGAVVVLLSSMTGCPDKKTPAEKKTEEKKTEEKKTEEKKGT